MIRFSLALLCAPLVASWLAACTHRTSTEAATQIRPPLSAVQFSYRRWDHHLIQWLDTHPKYETVEALIDEDAGGRQVHFFLTEREAVEGSKQQHHYVSDTALAETLSLSAARRNVEQVEIELAENRSTHQFLLELTTREGLARWQFDSVGTPSEQYGAGLIDNAEAAHDLAGGFLVFYLEAATLAEANTELRLGDDQLVVSEWTELSQPPHFTAHRGVYSTGVHLGYFYTASQVQCSVPDPAPLRVGLNWRQDCEMGARHESFTTQVSEVRDDHIIFVNGPRSFITTHSDQGLLIESIEVSDHGSVMALRFSPALPDLQSMPIGQHRFAFSLDIDTHTDVVQGSLEVLRSSTGARTTLNPENPEWTLPLEHVTDWSFGDTSLRYSSHMVYPDHE